MRCDAMRQCDTRTLIARKPGDHGLGLDLGYRFCFHLGSTRNGEALNPLTLQQREWKDKSRPEGERTHEDKQPSAKDAITDWPCHALCLASRLPLRVPSMKSTRTH